jgi:membrane protease YdiL (CAAX protease family)
MNSLHPDNPPAPAPAPHERQPESFAPPFGAEPAEPPAEFRLGLQFEPQPLPDRPARPDARTPFRGIDLVYLVVFYFLSGGVIFFLVATGAFIFFGVPLSELKDSTPASAAIVIITQALLSGAALCFLYVVVRGRSAAPFWQTMGWRGFRNITSYASIVLRYVLGGFALAVVVGWLGNFVGPESGIPMERLLRSPQSVLMLMALGIFVAPLVEETIFRGCIYPVIARKFGITTGIVATGALFGLAHAQQLGFAWGQIALIICVGVVLTYVRARAGTVAASYLVHLGYNTTLFAAIFISTGGLRHLPTT